MKHIHAAALASLLLAVPVFAQTTPATKTSTAKAAPAAKAATPTVHVTKGVVKSVDATMLVISKAAGKGPDTTFVLNGSTEKQGNITTGASVDVRYHTEGKSNVATGVTVHEAKAAAAKTKTKSTK